MRSLNKLDRLEVIWLEDSVVLDEEGGPILKGGELLRQEQAILPLLIRVADRHG